MGSASIERAFSTATQTRALEIGADALNRAPEIFAENFGVRRAKIVADINTFRAAGENLLRIFSATNIPCESPFIFDDELEADYARAELLRNALARNDCIAVAVGGGTINDLTKLASGELERPYVCVATAASVDGYAAYGAAITKGGAKRTLDCPAPRAILADTRILACAPPA